MHLSIFSPIQGILDTKFLPMGGELVNDFSKLSNSPWESPPPPLPLWGLILIGALYQWYRMKARLSQGNTNIPTSAVDESLLHKLAVDQECTAFQHAITVKGLSTLLQMAE